MWTPTLLFSSDGHRLAFVRGNDPDPGKFRIISLGVEGGEETVLKQWCDQRLFIRAILVTGWKNFCLRKAPTTGSHHWFSCN